MWGPPRGVAVLPALALLVLLVAALLLLLGTESGLSGLASLLPRDLLHGRIGQGERLGGLCLLVPTVHHLANEQANLVGHTVRKVADRKIEELDALLHLLGRLVGDEKPALDLIDAFLQTRRELHLVGPSVVQCPRHRLDRLSDGHGAVIQHQGRLLGRSGNNGHGRHGSSWKWWWNGKNCKSNYLG